ncbi:MAG: NUDIX domain-containing protein [Candidatus Daviesbacteria bacterium]|nr:NUDIX domain-containing protein [Candidatus Daviesbacteria bacterium]
MEKHFVATAYIIAKIDNQYKVLLHKHKKLGIWIGIGGHIESDENPIECVLREIKEETNLEVRLLNGKKLLETEDVRELIHPATIIEEDIPQFKNEPAHHHIDLIYFAFCKNPKKIKMKEEYKWFNKRELQKSKLLKEVLVFASRTLDFITSL